MGKQIINGDVEITGQLLKGDLKALYHLGAYDSVDTSNADYDVITRGTGYHKFIGNETWVKTGSNSYTCSIITNAVKKSSASSVLANISSPTLSTHTALDIFNAVVSSGIGVNDEGIIFISASDYANRATLVNGTTIEYELADSYKHTERVLKNQPLSTLDQNGENWLRGEYGKTLNLINGIFTNGQAYAGTGNTYSDSNAKCILLKLEPNTQYALNNGGYSWINEYDSAGTFLRQKPAPGTFTTSSDCVFVGLTYPITANAMLNLGSTALPYQPYNGKVMHAIDVEGVKLWENGNPNSSFGAQSVTTADMSQYRYLRFEVKITNDANQCAQCIVVKKEIQKNIYLSIHDDTSTNAFNRKAIVQNSTTIRFADGYLTSTDNNASIPLAIYGIK